MLMKGHFSASQKHKDIRALNVNQPVGNFKNMRVSRDNQDNESNKMHFSLKEESR